MCVRYLTTTADVYVLREAQVRCLVQTMDAREHFSRAKRIVDREGVASSRNDIVHIEAQNENYIHRLSLS